jgi:ATP-dependent HslUV protease subunit HslV
MDRNDMSAGDIARRAMEIAANICVYTNDSVTLEKL